MKKKLFMLIGLMVIMLLGVSYAWFNYNQTGENQKLITGDLYLVLEEATDEITINNVYPMSKEKARARNDNYITFTVSGINTSTTDNIYYEIMLENGEAEEGLERFNPEHLVFDLIEIGNNNEETYLLDAVSFPDINERKIWVDTVLKGTTQEINKTYKLRMWLSDKILISDSDSNRDYYATGEHAFDKHYASIKVGVYGDMREKSLPSSTITRESYVENGKSYFMTYLTNDYLLEEEGELLDENDVVTLEITNPENKIYFSYVDSKGNENTSQNESLTLTYNYNRNETVNIKVFTESKNDSNVETTLHFKVTKNGNIVQEYNKEIYVIGNNYCLNNGFTNLADCILVTENLSNNVASAKAYINTKGSPNVNTTAPTYTYVEKAASDSSIKGTTLTTKWYFSDSYSFNTTTGTFALKNSNGNTVNTANNQHELSEDYIGYYTFGSNTTTSGSTISRVTAVDLANNKITTSRITYQIASSLDSEQGLYKVEDDDGDSYIFRGDVKNNNVSFGGYYWKILRINGDGSIRLIFNGNSLSANGNKTAGNNVAISSTSNSGINATYAFNTMYTGPTFTGYMPSLNGNINESQAETHSNISSSSEFYFADDYKIVFDSNGPLFQLLGKDKDLVKSTLSNMQNNGNITTTPYTCLETTKDGTCKKLYKVSTINSGTSFTGTTYSVSLQMQIATNTKKSGVTPTTVYYWGDDYEIAYDANGPLFKLKKNQYDIVGKTLGAMKNDAEQFAKTPYWCGTTADGGCRGLHKVTSITSETEFKGDRYHFSPQTKEDSEKNGMDSTAKKQLDAWYETKFMNNQNNGKVVTDYIVDGTFCNDRSITRTSDYNSGYLVTTYTYFAPRTRLQDAIDGNKTATLICANTNDKFSVTSAKGNAKLTYPVALITADEVALAGGKYNEKNENFYLRTNGNFWTMSPSHFHSTYAFATEFIVYTTGVLDSFYSVHSSYGLRAVINLKANTLISAGDGSAAHPYIIE